MDRTSAPLALALLLGIFGCNGDDDGSPPGIPPYEPCTDSAECDAAAPQCAVIAWEAGRDGQMCTKECEVNEDCPASGANAGVCWELVVPGMTRPRSCFERCMTTGDCPPAYVCAEAAMGMTVVDHICLPE